MFPMGLRPSYLMNFNDEGINTREDLWEGLGGKLRGFLKIDNKIKRY
jgi:hypothetical protein